MKDFLLLILFLYNHLASSIIEKENAINKTNNESARSKEKKAKPILIIGISKLTSIGKKKL
tara:strand:- start:243 stop:425 length:183 start_codon:yes stop_codon:yes gene_type:complete